MPTTVNRQTVDLSAYPDLVVIYLGMRVRTLAGIKKLLGLGPRIDKAGAARPEGLLHYENNIIFRLFPLHLGMRWYWKDFGSMERWARSEPHQRGGDPCFRRAPASASKAKPPPSPRGWAKGICTELRARASNLEILSPGGAG